MFRHVLAAIDGTEASSGVVRAADDLAISLDAELTIISVVGPLPPFVAGSGADTRQLTDDARAEAERVVDSAIGNVRRLATGIVRSGIPGDEIVRQIDEGGHDVVVLGSRGRGRIASRVFGSVVGDVHFGSETAMLVVPRTTS